MAETITPRVGLIRWSAGTDTPSRVDFNTSMDAIEAQMAIDQYGTSVPAAGIIGRWYYHTGTNVFYRDNGTTMVPVASNAVNMTVKPSTTAAVAFKVRALTSQTGLLVDVQNAAGANFFNIAAEGDIITRNSRVLLRGNPSSGQHVVSITTNANAEEGVEIIIPDTSTRKFIEMKKLTGAITFSVAHDGKVKAENTDFTNAEVTNNLTTETIGMRAGSMSKINLNPAGGAAIGMQSGSASYVRTESLFHIYKNGVHSNTAGDAGAGGVVLVTVGSTGSITANNRLVSKNTDTPIMDTTAYGITVGDLVSNNAVFAKHDIQARNNGAATDFGINRIGGGNVQIGHSTLSNTASFKGVNVDIISTGRVEIDAPETKLGGTTRAAYQNGIFKINEHRLHIGGQEPVAPVVGDIWLQI